MPPKLDSRRSKDLEKRLERVITDVVQDYESDLSDVRTHPKTMHFMAKAATAAYEAALEQISDNSQSD